jgi:hypothetical protein
MAQIVVQKLDARGRLVTSYTAVVIERFAGGVLLDARWERPTLALGYMTFETGDRFREWFYSDQWRNIFEIATNDGALKGSAIIAVIKATSIHLIPREVP